MKIITLVGRSNSGKTMTLKTLIFQLLHNGGKLNYQRPSCMRKDYFLSYENAERLETVFLEQMKQPSTCDTIADLTAKFDYHGKTVAITTTGDTKECIKNRYDKCQPCGIFVCASHNTEVVISYLESLGEVTYIPQCAIERTKDAAAMDAAILKRNESVTNEIRNKI